MRTTATQANWITLAGARCDLEQRRNRLADACRDRRWLVTNTESVTNTVKPGTLKL